MNKCMRHLLAWAVAAVLPLCSLLGAETASDGSKGISKAFQKDQPAGRNAVSIAGKKAPGKKKRRLRIHEVTHENDIRYRGPLSYQHFQILGWLCIVLSAQLHCV